MPSDAQPLDVGEVGDLGKDEPSGGGVLDDGPGDRVLRGALEGGGETEQRVASAAVLRCRTVTTSVTDIRPVVTVPVLSRTTVSTRRVASSTSGPRISMPSWAPRPLPTSSAVGVASPSAQGQAMISTATAAENAASTG